MKSHRRGKKMKSHMQNCPTASPNRKKRIIWRKCISVAGVVESILRVG